MISCPLFFSPRRVAVGAALLAALATAAEARTWFVAPGAAPGADGGSWERALPALAPALAAARPGDAIWVRRGKLDLDATARLPSGVALHGGFAGTEASPEDRRGINFANETVLRIRKAGASVVEIAGARGVRLDGFTLTGATGAPGVVLRGVAESVVLANCRIAGNSAPEPGAGMRVTAHSTPRIFNCQIADNRAAGNGGGLFIDETSGGDWSWCIFSGNTAAGAFGGGALIAAGATPKFTRCDFYFNRAAASGSALACGGGFTLGDCVVSSNLATGDGPGFALRVQGGTAPLVLAGDTYVVGNVRQRAEPEYASGIDGEDRCELRAAAIVSKNEKGRADPDLLGRRDDLHTVMYDVFAPPLTTGKPAPGKWVRQTLPSRASTAAYHCVYLPTDWAPGRKYPLLVGFPGNGPYRNRFGDRSGGMPEDNPMGIGVSGGRGFVVLGLGYLDSRKNLLPTGSWWGDVQATIAYAKEAIRHACENLGADPRRVVLFGFSRSAIGASFIGLHDDTIAPLWRAFLCYDGWESQADMARNWYRHDQSSYNYDPRDFDGTGVAQRFRRLAGRPLFILGGRGAVEALNAGLQFPVELLAKPHRNHNVSWALRDTPERAQVRAWLERVVGPEQTETRK